MVKQIENGCIMCGAKADQPCTVIAGGYPPDDLKPGDKRPKPHFYR